jgi:hypothetical protein
MAGLLALSAAQSVEAQLGLELRFERLNGPYDDLVAQVEPIESGPVTIRLSSPEHHLELKENQLDLSPLGGGLHAVRGLVRFSGTGKLIADLDFGGVPASLQDEVVFPEQETIVEGKIRIEVVDDGYRLTVEDLPRFIDLEIHSKLGSELVVWCSRLALFVAGDAGCGDLDRELSHPRLPLPAPGASHLVRRDELTAAEQAQLDLYLAEL